MESVGFTTINELKSNSQGMNAGFDKKEAILQSNTVITKGLMSSKEYNRMVSDVGYVGRIRDAIRNYLRSSLNFRKLWWKKGLTLEQIIERITKGYLFKNKQFNTSYNVNLIGVSPNDIAENMIRTGGQLYSNENLRQKDAKEYFKYYNKPNEISNKVDEVNDILNEAEDYAFSHTK